MIHARTWRARKADLVLVLAAVLAFGADVARDDDRTFRPTVIVRKGNSQGSGTIIASLDRETLVLTASHVVRGEGPLWIELHRYNLGVESTLPAHGWPLRVPGEIAGADPTADVAVVRVKNRGALPFVASIVAPGDEPKRGTTVTSVGIDGGNRLGSWESRVEQVVWFTLDAKPADEAMLRRAGLRADPSLDGGDRLFLITGRAPEHGRSGGALFLDGGRVAGVCVGRIEMSERPAVGVFASSESIRRLLRRHALDETVARSDAARTPLVITPTGSSRRVPGASRPPTRRGSPRGPAVVKPGERAHNQ